eukprot:1619274-Amphidinium_carterae.6
MACVAWRRCWPLSQIANRSDLLVQSLSTWRNRSCLLADGIVTIVVLAMADVLLLFTRTFTCLFDSDLGELAWKGVRKTASSESSLLTLTEIRQKRQKIKVLGGQLRSRARAGSPRQYRLVFVFCALWACVHGLVLNVYSTHSKYCVHSVATNHSATVEEFNACPFARSADTARQVSVETACRDGRSHGVMWNKGWTT